jgi:hypothetical protein
VPRTPGPASSSPTSRLLIHQAIGNRSVGPAADNRGLKICSHSLKDDADIKTGYVQAAWN